MRDLQRRLSAAGFPPAGAEAATFCRATEEAVRAFQSGRGLRSNGCCDEQTWTALVEASWKLGNRLLFLTSPNLRGDDVADLQSRLTRLGFDCGRVDGILGPRTARALEEFQSNCGTSADGVCGPDTVRTLTIMRSQSGEGPGIAAVRERDRLRTGLGSVAQCRIVVGQYGGLSALTRTLSRELRMRGATVMSLDEPDAVAQATAANHFAADAYLGFETNTEPCTLVQFYSVPTFESVGGRSLAELIAGKLEHISDLAPEVRGMRLQMLRETRMPAVQCVFGPVREAIDAGPAIATAIVEALDAWVSRST
ncbi:MAG: peptidoglycan-binding protein [Ilumatobacteraceae bacterium]